MGQIISGDFLAQVSIASLFLLTLKSLPLLLAGLFALMYLETKVDESGIFIRFFPFLNKHWTWAEIQSYELISYSPIGDFGGWGIRMSGRTTAYTVGGNHGLELKLNNGKRVVIGTQRPEALQEFLENQP